MAILDCLIVAALLHYGRVLPLDSDFLQVSWIENSSLVGRSLLPLVGLPPFLARAPFRPEVNAANIALFPLNTPHSGARPPEISTDLRADPDDSFLPEVPVGHIIDESFFDRPLNLAPARRDEAPSDSSFLENVNSVVTTTAKPLTRSRLKRTGYIDLAGIYHEPVYEPSFGPSDEPSLGAPPPSALLTVNEDDLYQIMTQGQQKTPNPSAICQLISVYYQDYADVCCTTKDREWHSPLMWTCGRVPGATDVAAILHRVVLTQCRRPLKFISLWIVSSVSNRAYLQSGAFFHQSICSSDSRISLSYAHLETDIMTLFSPLFPQTTLSSLCRLFGKTSSNNPTRTCHLIVGEPDTVKVTDIVMLHKKLGIFVAANSGLFLFNGTHTSLGKATKFENRGVVFLGHSCAPGQSRCAPEPTLSLEHAESCGIEAFQPIYVHDLLIHPNTPEDPQMKLLTWLGFVGYPIKLPDSASSSLILAEGLYAYQHGLPRLTFAFGVIKLPIVSEAGPVIFLDFKATTESTTANILTIFTNTFQLVAPEPIQLKTNVMLAFPAGNLRLKEYTDSFLDVHANDNVSMKSIELQIAAVIVTMDYLINEHVYMDGPKSWKKISVHLICQKACYVANHLFLPEPPENLKNVWI